MKMQYFNIIKLLVFFTGLGLLGCSSGEYDIDEYEVNYTEKTIKADTIKKIVYDDDKIKDDKLNVDKIKDDKKDSYTFIIQVGAFIVKSNFEKFYEKARQDLGPDLYYEQQNDLYKIRIGKFGGRAEAILMLEKVKSLGYNDAFILTIKN
jgi:cell division protein FtsN